MEAVLASMFDGLSQQEEVIAYGPEVFTCSIAILFSGILCSAAGIGGGTVYVVVLMIVGKLSALNAVPMSKVIVFFGAVASLVTNLFQWTRRPVVDIRVCRVVVPPVLMGTLLGVHFNQHSEEVIIVAFLAVLMVLLTVMVLYLACQQNRQEAAFSTPGSPITPDPGHVQSNPQDGGMQEHHMPPKQSLDAWDILHSCCLLFLVVLGQVLHFELQECGKHVHSSASKAGTCPGLFALPLFIWRNNATIAIGMQRMALSFPFLGCTLVGVYHGYLAETQAGWGILTIAMYQVTSVATGFVAGFAGVGGGVVLSPFFLLMGLEPAIAVGTSSTCLLFTSLSTATQYLFMGRVNTALALPYGLMSLVSAAVGTLLVHGIQSRYGSRRSLVTFTVVAGLALATGLTMSKLSVLIAGLGSQQQ